MTTEQKAKAYDEALERAKQLLRTSVAYDKFTIEKIFPELEEFEDDRISKEIIKYLERIVPHHHRDEVLKSKEWTAWLEKQGKKESNDKNEPKFKVGDWITNSIETVQITGYDIDYGYQVDYKGNLQHRDTDIIEKEYHLWTIADAMDGDILISKDKDDILIYKSYSIIELLLTSYISFSKKEGFCPRQYSAWDSNEFIPATKEQCDLLFQKMKEAGYEWLEETKELKKIEQKPAWSEEDERMRKDIIRVFKGEISFTSKKENEKYTAWLKSLRNRITWKPSEEQMNAFEQVYDWYNNNFAPSETLTSLYNDLKKLREE